MPSSAQEVYRICHPQTGSILCGIQTDHVLVTKKTLIRRCDNRTLPSSAFSCAAFLSITFNQDRTRAGVFHHRMGIRMRHDREAMQNNPNSSSPRATKKRGGGTEKARRRKTKMRGRSLMSCLRRDLAFPETLKKLCSGWIKRRNIVTQIYSTKWLYALNPGLIFMVLEKKGSSGTKKKQCRDTKGLS